MDGQNLKDTLNRFSYSYVLIFVFIPQASCIDTILVAFVQYLPDTIIQLID